MRDRKDLRTRWRKESMSQVALITEGGGIGGAVARRMAPLGYGYCRRF
jgi:hypothetical protein